MPACGSSGTKACVVADYRQERVSVQSLLGMHVSHVCMHSAFIECLLCAGEVSRALQHLVSVNLQCVLLSIFTQTNEHIL